MYTLYMCNLIQFHEYCQTDFDELFNYQENQENIM